MAHEPRSGGTGALSVEEYLALEQTTGVQHGVTGLPLSIEARDHRLQWLNRL
jgi:hypothetical protein